MEISSLCQGNRTAACDQTDGGARAPLLRRIGLFYCYCCDRAAVGRLLAVTRIAASGIGNPCFVVPEFKNLGAEFGAEPASDTGIHINYWRRHNHHSFLDGAVLTM